MKRRKVIEEMKKRIGGREEEWNKSGEQKDTRKRE